MYRPPTPNSRAVNALESPLVCDASSSGAPSPTKPERYCSHDRGSHARTSGHHALARNLERQEREASRISTARGHENEEDDRADEQREAESHNH